MTTPTITPQGVNAATAMAALNKSITITHVSLGSESYEVTPGWSELDIRGRREVAAITDGADNGNRSLTVTAHFKNSSLVGADYPAGVIGFHIGHPDSGGVLFAVWSEPGAVIAIRSSAALAEFVASWTLQLEEVPAGSVTVVIDPSSGFDAQVMRMHMTPELVPHPHAQYVMHTQPQGLTAPQRAQARDNIAAEVAGAGAAALAAAVEALAEHAALVAGAHTPAAVGAEPAGAAANAVAEHAALEAGAHTPAAVGAEPAGAVETHFTEAPHYSEAAIQTIVAAAVADAVAAAEETLQEAIDAEAAKSRPIGKLFYHFDTTAPAGASALNGAVLNRADRPQLWAWVSARPALLVTDEQWNETPINRNNKIKFSSGNETTTFRMPLADGAFLRAINTGSGLVPGGLSVAQWFDDMTKLHGHPYITSASNNNMDATGGLVTDYNEGSGPVTIHPPFTGTPSPTPSVPQSELIGGFGGEETRPAGFGVLLCMWDGS